MPLRRLAKRSLFLTVAVSIVFSVVTVVAINSTYGYFSEKSKIVEEMEHTSQESLRYLGKDLVPYMESYAVSEYEKLIQTEMEHYGNQIIVVEDDQMSQVLGRKFITGKIRTSEGHIVDFDSQNRDHLQQLDECYYKKEQEVTSSYGEKLGSVTICMTGSMLEQKKDEIITSTILNAAFTSFFTVLVVLAVLHRLLIRPVSEIAAVVSHADRYGIPTQPIPIYEAEEMAALSRAMNKMIDSIKCAREEMQEFNSRLEMRVAHQTQELRAHVEDLGRANDELRLAKEQAMSAARTRADFISNVSHELRTPLNAIINFSDVILEDFESMLDDEELQEDAREYLQRIYNNSNHLLSLINDILDFSKIEANKVELDIECVDMVPLLSQLHANCRPDGEKLKQIDYRLSLPEQPVLAYIDRRRFSQVVYNLLSNAIKFTQSGSIELRCIVEGEGGCLVEVVDTGRGIPQEQLMKIFEPFSQVNQHDKGTGLGLGISKRLCEGMGVKIDVKSEEAKGTTFRLVLPVCEGGEDD